MIQFKCGCCGQLLQLGDEWAGKVCKCPFSGQYMQVPMMSAAPAMAPAPAPPPAPAPASAGGGGSFNPFSNIGAAAPPAPPGPTAPAPDFGAMAGTRQADVHQRSKQKSQQAVWQSRGTLLGALLGAVVGTLFAVIISAFPGEKTTARLIIVALSVILGCAVSGAGVGGIIGPLALIAMDRRPKKWNAHGAVMGALYGTMRVAGFGAVGGVIPGVIAGAMVLMTSNDVAEAVLALVTISLLTAIAWAAVGAFLGAAFGAARGALGGYEG